MGLSTFPETSSITTAKRLKYNPSIISSSIQLSENTVDRSATVYGDSKFVIARTNQGMWTSTDGKNWKITASYGPFNSATPSSIAFWDLQWNGSYWLAVLSDGTLRKSTDLVTWTTPGTLPFTPSSGAKLVYKSTGTATWLLVANNATTLQHLAYSTDDGVTWTNSSSDYQTATTTTTGRTYSAVWDGTNFIVVAAAGKIATSPNGSTWTNRTNTFGTSAITSIATNGTRVVAGGAGGLSAYSNDNGATWTANTTLASASGIQHIVWDGSRFVCLDAVETNFYYSTTGTGTWTAGATFTTPTTVSSVYSRGLATNGSGTVFFQSASFGVYTTDVTTGTPTSSIYDFCISSTNDSNSGPKTVNRFVKDGTGKYWHFGSAAGVNGRPFVLTSTDNGASWVLGDNAFNKFDMTDAPKTGQFQIDFAGYANNTLFAVATSTSTNYYFKHSTDNGATLTRTAPATLFVATPYGLVHNGTYFIQATSGALNGGTALAYASTINGSYTNCDAGTVSTTGSVVDLRNYGSLVTCSTNQTGGGYVVVSTSPTAFTSLAALYGTDTGGTVTPINLNDAKLVPGPNGKIVYFGTSGSAGTSERIYVGSSTINPFPNPGGTTTGGIYFTEAKFTGVDAAAFKAVIVGTAPALCVYANYSDNNGWTAVYKRTHSGSNIVYYVITSTDGTNFYVNPGISLGSAGVRGEPSFGVLDDKLFMYLLTDANNSIMYQLSNGTDTIQIPV